MTQLFSSKQASKQASKFSLNLPLALAASYFFSPIAFGAWSTPANYYYEQTPNGSWTTPHEDPITRGGVTFDSSPIPYVHAKTAVYNPNGFILQSNEGTMQYSFDVSGAPASSYVPVSFRGLFSMSGDDLNKGFIPADIRGTQVKFGIGSAAWDNNFAVTQRVRFETDCRFFHCPSNTPVLQNDTLSQIAFQYDSVNPNGVSGEFWGNLMMMTNQFGQARGVVTLSAYTKFNGGFTPRPTSVDAVIDPYLFIDPAWLSSHPGASLVLPLGVGNQPSAVPVPTAAWLFGTGLLGLFGLKRQRSI
jgi:hypothetical protein